MFDKLVIALISPLGTSLMLSAWGWLLLWLDRRRWALLVHSFALLWLLIWSLPVTSNAILSTLESAYPAMTQAQVNQAPKAQAIVVLGGAFKPIEQDGEYPDMSDTSDRVWHAARLYYAGKAPLLVLSGGSDPKRSLTSEAEAMRVLLRDLRVPDSALLLEGKSLNTRENAAFTTDLLRERNINHILLVTSSMHMPRALALFQGQGLQVTAAPTDRQASLPGLWGARSLNLRDFFPDTGALDNSSRAIKEIVGRWVAK